MLAKCNYLGVTPAPEDPTLDVAERQLAMLGELAEMAMAVSRAFAGAGIAAARAAGSILNDEAWQSESDRALAITASGHAAEAFQKVSRALRLTLKLEKSTAEWLRDERLGIRREARDETPDNRRDRPRGEQSAGAEPDSERLVELERGDILQMPSFAVASNSSTARGGVGGGPPAEPVAEGAQGCATGEALSHALSRQHLQASANCEPPPAGIRSG